MQGPSHLDLARTLAEEHLRSANQDTTRQRRLRRHTVRHWLGAHLISIGESLTPKPSELQLKASTGPPCC